MKLKIFYPLIMVGLMLSTTGFSNNLHTVSEATTANEKIRVEELTKRLDEISTMDFKKMSRNEKKGLKKEVRTIKKEMKTMGGGVYISVGALLLIIILLLLL